MGNKCSKIKMSLAELYPRGGLSPLVGDGGRGSDTVWVCEPFPGIPLGTLFGA